MIKYDELHFPTSCINKAKDNEPIFVLRAQDKLASSLVRMWAELAELHGCDKDKVDEAYSLAEMMDAWPERKFPD